MKYVVGFSGGRSSAYMLLQLIERGYPIDKIIFNNTGKEREETLVFVEQVGDYLKREIIWTEYRDSAEGYVLVDFATASRKGEPFAALIQKKSFLPNVVARFCTTELKLRPQKKYLLSIGFEHWIQYSGIRYDEPLRWGRILQNSQKERWTQELPMVDWETTTADVMSFWRSMPFDLKLKQHEGNCDLCMLKGKAKTLQILRDTPNSAEWWIAQEDLTGAQFRKDISMRQLVQKSEQPLLFDEYGDIDFPCFCNAD